MNVFEMHFLAALIDVNMAANTIVSKDKLKEAVAKASEEYNADIRCEINKLKKEYEDEKKYLDKLIAETNETEHKIELIDTMIQKLENIDERINN